MFTSGVSQPRCSSLRRDRGGVLLEAVLALALFMVAVGFVTSVIATAVPATQRLRLEAEAVDLASTVLSELRLGLRPLVDAGPAVAVEPWEEWTWQVHAQPRLNDFGDSGLRDVQVIVRHAEREQSYRLYALLPLVVDESDGEMPEDELDEAFTEEEPGSGGGGDE